MWQPMQRRGALDIAVRAILVAAFAQAAGSSARAGDGEWTLRLEPMFMELHGHDPHVLTIHEIDVDSTPSTDDKTAVDLETDSGLAFRGGVQYARGQWGWGVDFWFFNTGQAVPNSAAAASAPSGSIDEVVFEIADQSFSSTDPDDVLFYDVLEDTDVTAWTADLYAVRTLVDKPDSDVRLLFGLRNADFDNDYRAVVGIQDVGGSRLDASSNYDRMLGPLVALGGSVRRGKHTLEGSLGQSVVLGSVELIGMSSEFTGPFSAPTYVDVETLRGQQDVAIPITELRIQWSYAIGKRFSLGAGVHTSAWWDVTVPPGVAPIDGGDEALHENTLVFFGLLGSAQIRF